MIKVLLIGQTPPPYYGQSMMIKRLVEADLKDVKIYHLRMSFSDTAKSVGRFQPKKICHLVHIIFHSIKLRFTRNINMLYYFPAGPNWNPILRDFFILTCIRPFFGRTILHFRAAGISDFLIMRNKILRGILSFPYAHPDVAIQLSSLNPEDGKFVHAKKIIIVPNGIEDGFDPGKRINKMTKSSISILFAGALHKTKGIYNFVEAAKIIRNKNRKVDFHVLGEFYDKRVEKDILHMILDLGLTSCFHLHGVKLGDDKWYYYYHADIFCFPTYFESESFGNVLLEAMMFELPIIGTKWRAIPDIVRENENGLLVNTNDSSGLAKRLLELIQDPEKRKLYGLNGRKRYEEMFTLEKHIVRMNEVFLM